MALTWPASLPQSFLVNSFVQKAPNNIVRSAVDSGPAKTRRRFTATTIPISGSMIMTKAQFLTFKTFFRDTIFDGALEFDMTDDVDGGIMTVKFNEPYEASFLGTVWEVSLSLDKQP